MVGVEVDVLEEVVYEDTEIVQTQTMWVYAIIFQINFIWISLEKLHRN